MNEPSMSTYKSRLSRRTFLQSAALLSAAPSVFRYAFAQERTTPNERITTGHIGVGSQGGGLMGRFLGDSNTQVVAVCDVSTERREAAKERVEAQYAEATRSGTYKGCAAYNDFRELLARDDIDAVVIATPDHWHAIIAIEAAKAGKDIYCEKPLSLTIREARAMVEATRRYGRVFQTGSQQRSAREFRFACELVRNGYIGQLQTIHANVGGPSQERYLPAEPVPAGFDWDMWLGPAPDVPFHRERVSCGGWRGNRDYSGGGMTDWGAHHFDISQWALGMDHSGPVRITPPNGNDVKALTFEYSNGVKLLHSGKANGVDVRGILFTGSEGKIEVDRGYLKTWPAELSQTVIKPDEIHLYESRDHVGNWLTCIRTRQKPVADVEIGARSVTVCHLGNIAYWLGRSLQWDPTREEIIGDEEATRWLDRPKRAPWHL
jgi:predicted dehydrogenase